MSLATDNEGYMNASNAYDAKWAEFDAFFTEKTEVDARITELTGALTTLTNEAETL